MSGMEGFSLIDGFRGMSRFMGANPSSREQLMSGNPAECPTATSRAPQAPRYRVRWRQRDTRPRASK